ncbi:MAG: hypothetical protein VB022_08730 [Rikenellaceae bacterium]|nr:hypothetical protein [Rikenellaceae bacterium]
METEFDKFQLEEYKNISNAHFEANKQIGIFFRYYLLVASAPAAIFLWFGKSGSIINELLSSRNLNLCLFIGFFLITISFIGLIFCFYMINLRFDSILYARTINGIRKYFYNKEKYLFENQIRVLPKQTSQPKYVEFHAFTIIVLAVALINSIYFGLGTRVIASIGDQFFNEYFIFKIPILCPNYNLSCTLIAALIFFSIHLIYYIYFSNYRNFSYMKNLTIGIDIDGVLNKHRDTFCEFLYNKTGKTLWADEIVKIPVSLIPNKNVERSDEFLVFNDINYWVSQKAIQENVGKIIDELKNTFGYKICVFSYRAWPDTTYLPVDLHQQTLETWKSYYFSEFKISKFLVGLFTSKNNLRFKTITSITKEWLEANGIHYNKLLIEKGSIDVNSISFNFWGIPKINFKNRFYYSRKKSYRYFVEDSYENAEKLSAYCEYVFLMDHPYNQIEPEMMPPNIIRVYSWSDIKEKIRKLG